MKNYVEFQDNEGKVFKSVKLIDFSSALIENPGDYVKDDELFHFIKWDKDLKNINESCIVKPIYEKTKNCLIFNNKNEIIDAKEYENQILYLPICCIVNNKHINITTIKHEAFINLNAIVGIYVPKQISIIETNAFHNKYPINLFLEQNEISDGFEEDWNADCITYYGCEASDILIKNDFVYLIKNNEVSLIRYLGNQISLFIKKCVKYNDNYYDIKTLRQYAFYLKDNLEFIYAPNTIQKTYEFAIDCPNLVVCFENNKVFGRTNLEEEDYDEVPMYLGIKYDYIINDDDFLFVIKNNYAILIKYFGNEDKVIVPREVKNDLGTYYVRKIGAKAFINKKTKELELPNTIIDIHYDAFKNSGIENNFKLCSDLFLIEQQEAKNGDSEAYINMGKMYEEGLGITYSQEEAIECYLKAIDLGNKSACTQLGIIYMNKGRFIPARQYFLDAESINDKEALYYLGIIYLFGFEVITDYVKAREYFTKAMKLNEPKAKEILRELDPCGIGLEIDKDEIIRRTTELSKTSIAAKCFLGLLVGSDNFQLSLSCLNEASYCDYPFASFAYSELLKRLSQYKTECEVAELLDKLNNY